MFRNFFFETLNKEDIEILEQTLSKMDATIEDILDFNKITELLHKCPNFLSNFINNQKIRDLIDIIVIENYDEECSLEKRYKYPKIATEILSSEAIIIVNYFLPPDNAAPEHYLCYDYQNLSYIFEIFENKDKNNISLTSLGYLCQVLKSLIEHRRTQFYRYLVEKKFFANINLLKLFSSFSAGVEVLTDILTIDTELSNYDKTATFLDERVGMLQNLFQLFENSTTTDDGLNSSFVIAYIFSTKTISDQDILVDQVCTGKNLEILFIMLNSKNTKKSKHALSILQIIITYINDESKTSKRENVRSLFFETYFSCIKIIENLLEDEIVYQDTCMLTKEKKVGIPRMQGVYLLACGAGSGDNKILTTFFTDGLPKKLLELFFLFPWNNIFHNHIVRFFENCFLSKIDPIIKKQIIEQCQLPEKIIAATKIFWEGEHNQSKFRTGNIGHIIMLSKILKKISVESPVLANITNTPEWLEYEKLFLQKIAEKEEPELGETINSCEVTNNMECIPSMQEEKFPTMPQNSILKQ